MADQPALPPQLTVPDGLPLPQRTWAILTIALGLTLAVLDGAIANVALPTIARDVDASPAASIWVVASLGMAVGFGYFAIAIFTSALVIVTLVAIRPLERLFFKNRRHRRHSDMPSDEAAAP